MAQQQGKGKRSKKGKGKHERYRREMRWKVNKLVRLRRHLRQLTKLKEKNPDSKIENSISQIKEAVKRWEKKV